MAENKGKRTPKSESLPMEDRCDKFVRCDCKNLVARQDKSNTALYRIKERDTFTTICLIEGYIRILCRKCGRIVSIARGENPPDIVSQARALKDKIEGQKST